MINLNRKNIKVFCVGPTSILVESVCRNRGLTLSLLKEERFPDGELKVRPDEYVRNSAVFVFHSLGGGARRTIGLIPYLP